MEFIVILDPDYRNHNPVENSHGFIEKFSTVEAANTFGKEAKGDKDCKEFAVYQRVDVK